MINSSPNNESYFYSLFRYYCCISNTRNNYDYNKMMDILEKDYDTYKE